MNTKLLLVVILAAVASILLYAAVLALVPRYDDVQFGVYLRTPDTGEQAAKPEMPIAPTV